jgi:divalent metal cation (Fe/Co/Zn/Cd) transporter
VARDPALRTVLAEDAAAVAGVLLAAGGLAVHHATGIYWPEGAASLAIAALLGVTAWRLGRTSEAMLIGQAADPVLLRDAYDGDRPCGCRTVYPRSDQERVELVPG